MHVISGCVDRSGRAPVTWSDPRLARVTALCLSARSGESWFDVLCCRGELADGTAGWVFLPFKQLLKGLERVTIVRHARSEGVFAKGLKVLESIIYLTDERSKDNQLACLAQLRDFLGCPAHIVYLQQAGKRRRLATRCSVTLHTSEAPKVRREHLRIMEAA